MVGDSNISFHNKFIRRIYVKKSKEEDYKILLRLIQTIATGMVEGIKTGSASSDEKLDITVKHLTNIIDISKHKI
jgi:hypothetical protein